MADSWEIKGDEPVKFKLIPDTLESPFRQDFPCYVDGLVKGEPGGFVFTPRYAQQAEDFRNFLPRPDDIWVLSFPKSGTTWTQELVWLVANDCDFEGAKEELNKRCPFLETMAMFPLAEVDTHGFTNPLEKLEKAVSKRMIKSHLPLYLLHPKLVETSKVVYVARNPKDVMNSYFHHHRHLKWQKFTNNLDIFANYFLDDKVMFGPYFPHVINAWNQRGQPNFLFLFYEDLKADLRGQIRKVAAFLQKQLTDAQLDQLCQHLRFDNFALNEAVNKEYWKTIGMAGSEGRFIRKGQVGDWKNYFSPDLNQRIDQWVESNLSGSDLEFRTHFDNN